MERRIQVRAIAYVGAGRPLWWDLTSYYGDDVTVTFTSMAATGLDQDPRHPNVNCPGLAFAELLEESLRKRPAGFIECPTGEFSDDFCRSYRESIEWRRSRGVSREELARFAAVQKKDLAGSDLDEATRAVNGNLRR